MASQKAVKTITSAIQRLYPKELADSSWDNTGLILGTAAGKNNATTENEALNILLTIDLTTAVCDEAIKNKSSMIMAYHPFIFRGLKSITPNDPQQMSLLKLVQAGISVYCPHTAVDAAVGGVNDWLADSLAQGDEAERSAIEPTSVESHKQGGGGMGRIVKLANPLSISDLVSRTKSALGMKHIQVALAEKHRNDEKTINSIAICAGSGGSLLRGVDADLHFTGELGHHELLYLVESGKSAIVCGHSNTERGFLKTFQSQLLRELKDHSGPVSVEISKFDKDPLETV